MQVKQHLNNTFKMESTTPIAKAKGAQAITFKVNETVEDEVELHEQEGEHPAVHARTETWERGDRRARGGGGAGGGAALPPGPRAHGLPQEPRDDALSAHRLVSQQSATPALIGLSRLPLAA